MYVVEPVVRGGDCYNPSTCRACCYLKSLIEMVHEGCNAARRGGQMAPNGYFAVTLLPHTAWDDRFRASVRVFDATEFIRHLVVKCLMHPREELDRCWSGQIAVTMHLVD